MNPRPDTAAPARRSLRLLTQHLSGADLAKMDVFLRLGQSRLQCDWTLVSEGEADVLVIAQPEPDTVLGLLDNPRATMRVIDVTHADLDSIWPTLTRPLQYDVLIEALVDVELLILGPSAVPPKPQPAVSLSAVPVKASTHAPLTATLSADTVYRLRRWPPSDLLRGHRYNIRLASFLSTRHVSLVELAELSNVGPVECAEFVGKLRAAHLLDMKRAEAPVASAPAPLEARAARPPARSDRGLFSKIRSSLGMGGNR